MPRLRLTNPDRLAFTLTIEFMVKRRVYDQQKHIHFVTFSCYKRRRLLDSDQPKRIVIGHLGNLLSKMNGICTGYVIMPDHVHAIIWFPETGQLRSLINQWKTQSSRRIKTFLKREHPN